MYSDSESAHLRSKSGTPDTLDFSHRAHLCEQMDEPCSFENLRNCLRDLAQVNRVTFAYRPTLQWLELIFRLSKPRRPLHIVDVGSGGGDMLRNIERWAAGKGIAVRLTGIDVNPNAVRAAREFTPIDSRIRWFTGQACSMDASSNPIDIVISSLFTHHLLDDEISNFLVWMESVAEYGWFINDLHRSKTPYFAFKALGMIAHWHPFVRHDGPVSIRRAFVSEEWQEHARNAGLPLDVISIKTRWPARLCISRIKRQ
jgi:SAM-dependent methyltransferase